MHRKRETNVFELNFASQIGLPMRDITYQYVVLLQIECLFYPFNNLSDVMYTQ